eukprot:14429065-Alexandrium_andersonii.AAC.1
MQSRAVPMRPQGPSPPATMASPSLLLGVLRGSPWPSTGQRGPACATSAWRTNGGGEIARASGPVARAVVRSPE